MQTEARDYQLSLEAEVEEERRQAEHQVRLLGRSNEADGQEVRVAAWQSSAVVVRVSETLSSLTVSEPSQRLWTAGVAARPGQSLFVSSRYNVLH